MPDTSPQKSQHEKHDPYQALRHRNFQYQWFGSLIGTLGNQMQGAAVGWDIYTRTHSPFSLGLVGLVQALPVLMLALPSGQIADRLDRRRIVISMAGLLALAWLGLYSVSSNSGPISIFYFFLFVDGVANALIRPARVSLLTQLVPLEQLPNAITWNSTRVQFSTMVGPALGGFAIAAFAGPAPVYLVAVLLSVVDIVCVILMRPRPQERANESISWQSISSGARFVVQNKLLLAPLSLDMLAVLFGGAVALMPIFAKDILHVGSTGYGLLLAAPSVGALLTLLFLAHTPPLKKAGKVLLWCVAGYGVAMIIFGASRWFWLSLMMLFIAGGLDSISVMIRHTLVQVITPDYLRGRVSSINGLFIGVSNELGGFESGTVAKFLGAMPTVVLGGIGTVLVVAGVAFKWPQLRELDTLQEAAEEARKEHENAASAYNEQ
jgi:MFS family permease